MSYPVWWQFMWELLCNSERCKHVFALSLFISEFLSARMWHLIYGCWSPILWQLIFLWTAKAYILEFLTSLRWFFWNTTKYDPWRIEIKNNNIQCQALLLLYYITRKELYIMLQGKGFMSYAGSSDSQCRTLFNLLYGFDICFVKYGR